MTDTKQTPTEIWSVDDSQNEDLPKLGIEPSGWVEIRVGDCCIGSTYSTDHKTNLRRAHEIVQAVNSHAASQALIAALTEKLEALSKQAQDVIDQMVKGNWVDEMGHDVRLNTAMFNLPWAIREARAALAKDHAKGE